MTLERMITTDMSANIVTGLLKRRWTLTRIARTIHAPIEFVQGVLAKTHVLTLADIKTIAAQTGESAPLMIFNSITDVPAHVKPLFEVTRQSLEASGKLGASLKRNSRRRRGESKVRVRTSAA